MCLLKDFKMFVWKKVAFVTVGMFLFSKGCHISYNGKISGFFFFDQIYKLPPMFLSLLKLILLSLMQKPAFLMLYGTKCFLDFDHICPVTEQDLQGILIATDKALFSTEKC